MKTRCNLSFLCGLLSTLALAANQQSTSQNWPQWRGPFGNGISDSKNLPITWSLEKNIVWKTALPSWSGGTPVIWGDRVFVTSPTAKPIPANGNRTQAQLRPVDFGGFGGGGAGKGGYGRGRDPGGSDLLLICISKKDGKLLWQRKLDEGNRTWNKQNSSSPSPVTDGKHAWVVTGTGAVAAFDMDGNAIWKHNLNDYGKIALNWGYASSPLLYKEIGRAHV